MVQLQKFGKYEIIRKLSRSMTDVYLASDTEAGRPVVLKMIEHSHDDFTQLVLEAEKRGALLQKQLHDIDARILQVYEFGEQNDCFFVSMEYFEGKTLAQVLLEEGRLDSKRAARYAAEICSQLRTLHSFASDVDGRKTAVVHGDIKPSNVQIGRNDEVRLLDFGIAKVITSTHNLTHHNLGSPSYCSPERISKSQVDQHADLWALGVSLYEMVGGSPPYQAQDTRKLENLIQSKRPPRALPAGCPAALKAVIAKSLAGDLARRYQSAESFETDLCSFLQDRHTAAEGERQWSWDANATIEKHPTEAGSSGATAAPSLAPIAKNSLQRVSRVRKNELSNVAIALLAGVLAGLLIFIPVGYYYRFSVAAEKLRGSRDYAHDDIQLLKSDWGLYKDLKHRNNFLGQWSPVASLDAPVHSHLIAAADNIIDGFRNSPDGQFSDFDWMRAGLCLRHALEIDPSDARAKGKLALCNGYFNLTQKPLQTAQCVESLREAQTYLPRLPDPHLALARVYVYEYHNVGRAVAELHQAQQLGYKLGPREAEEQADGYRFRAEATVARAKRLPATAMQQRGQLLQMARADIERARRLYEPIAGFSNVTTNLERLLEAEIEEAKLQRANVRLVAAKRPHLSKRYASIRRWQ